MHVRSINGRTGGGLHHPRHPSLDNLRRPQQQMSSRSFPQLPSLVDPILEEEENPLNILLGGLAALAAMVCVAGLIIILAVLYLTVRPFSKGAYRRLAAQVGCASFLDAMALLLPNTRLYLTGDSDVPSPVGTSVLILNHLMDGDWWHMLMLGRCVGLRGSIKVFLRNEIIELHKRTNMVDGTTVPVSATESKSLTFHRNNGSTAGGNGSARKASPLLSLAGRLLHILLEFPLLSGENNKNYISEREDLFQLLREFAGNNGTEAPVHLLLFPEGWSLHDGSYIDRASLMAKSNDFAKREGRPQLKHLLMPRTTGFNASLECLRESSPVVYDVTMAYQGYDGSIQPSFRLNIPTLWRVLRRKMPSEIHVRIKKYSMEEVLQDASWLDKQWAEKDQRLSHFSRHQSFLMDSRGFCRHRIFDTRLHSVESSFLALCRLLLIPCTIPILFMLSIPIFWVVLWLWLAYKSFLYVFPRDDRPLAFADDAASTIQAQAMSGFDSATGTPFFPATPFASPSVSNWRDMVLGNNQNEYNNADSPGRR